MVGVVPSPVWAVVGPLDTDWAAETLARRHLKHRDISSVNISPSLNADIVDWINYALALLPTCHHGEDQSNLLYTWIAH